MTMNTKNILPEFFRYVEQQDTKIAKKVRDWLDYDLLGAIILHDGTFWFEISYRNSMPNYCYEYIKRHLKKQGYRYLYDQQ